MVRKIRHTVTMQSDPAADDDEEVRHDHVVDNTRGVRPASLLATATRGQAPSVLLTNEAGSVCGGS